MSYDSVNNLLDLWKETNVVTDNLFSYFLLITVFIICAVAMQYWDKKNVFVASTSLTAIASLLMFLAGVLPQGALTICLSIFGASIIWLNFGGRD